GLDHAHDHAERGGLARAVAAEDANDFLLVEDEADLVNDHTAVVGFDQLGGFKKIHAGARRAVVSRQLLENQGVGRDLCTCGGGVDKSSPSGFSETETAVFAQMNMLRQFVAK